MAQSYRCSEVNNGMAQCEQNHTGFSISAQYTGHPAQFRLSQHESLICHFLSSENLDETSLLENMESPAALHLTGTYPALRHSGVFCDPLLYFSFYIYLLMHPLTTGRCHLWGLTAHTLPSPVVRCDPRGTACQASPDFCSKSSSLVRRY